MPRPVTILAAMPKTVILGTARTPFGKMGGALAPVEATELCGLAIRGALERAEVAPEQVEHLGFCQVLQAGPGHGPRRHGPIKGGIPQEGPSATGHKACAAS